MKETEVADENYLYEFVGVLVDVFAFNLVFDFFLLFVHLVLDLVLFKLGFFELLFWFLEFLKHISRRFSKKFLVISGFRLKIVIHI